MFAYPSPRYPRLKRPKSVEELMPKARELVNQPPDMQRYLGHPLKPSYNIKAGDKILFVVLSEYDPMVVEAMCRAMREIGACVDLLTLDSTPVAPPEELAVHEAIAFDKEEDDYSYYYTLITNLIRTSTAKTMVELGKYDMVIAGSAGPLPEVTFPWQRFNCTALEDFAGPLIDTQPDLQKLIDQKVWNQITSCEVLRLTDPEGTDIKWTNYKDERPFLETHILARPFNIGYGFGGRDDCAGVVAGTINHVGAFPHCKAYIERGQVVKVEGGGKYGEVWREKLEKYKNVELPSFPLLLGEAPKYKISDPGLFWFFECAIGTIPTVSRLPREGLFQNYANFLHDRLRTGYVHNGFGPAVTGQRELIEAGLPWVHVHIHSMFATLEGSTNKSETITVIDKGHLTALDDAEVRSLASRYGNPDELLKEVWFPAVPGINVPGDYMKDYAQDPVSWIKKEALEHPIWVD